MKIRIWYEKEMKEFNIKFAFKPDIEMPTNYFHASRNHRREIRIKRIVFCRMGALIVSVILGSKSYTDREWYSIFNLSTHIEQV
jgi:hypothetical protein